MSLFISFALSAATIYYYDKDLGGAQVTIESN